MSEEKPKRIRKDPVFEIFDQIYKENNCKNSTEFFWVMGYAQCSNVPEVIEEIKVAKEKYGKIMSEEKNYNPVNDIVRIELELCLGLGNGKVNYLIVATMANGDMHNKRCAPVGYIGDLAKGSKFIFVPGDEDFEKLAKGFKDE